MPISGWSRHNAAAKLGKNAGLTKSDYVDAVLDAISTAVSVWQAQAKIQDVKIMGPIAIATRGCVSGPNLGPLVKSGSPQNTDWERKMTAAIASATGSAWASWEKSIMIPGLPWYPSFAAYPGPMAPPTPNVPTPLLALSQNPAARTANAIKAGIKTNGQKLEYVEGIADHIGAVTLVAILAWTATVQIKNVLGKGPVPSFAPPYVPVGPVVMGDTIPLPGVFL